MFDKIDNEDGNPQFDSKIVEIIQERIASMYEAILEVQKDINIDVFIMLVILVMLQAFGQTMYAAGKIEETSKFLVENFFGGRFNRGGNNSLIN